MPGGWDAPLVFPAYAGMSRLKSLAWPVALGFPRLRGDEPGPHHAGH